MSLHSHLLEQAVIVYVAVITIPAWNSVRSFPYNSQSTLSLHSLSLSVTITDSKTFVEKISLF